MTRPTGNTNSWVVINTFIMGLVLGLVAGVLVAASLVTSIPAQPTTPNQAIQATLQADNIALHGLLNRSESALAQCVYNQ